ncbi:hypothetical protein LEM8419_03165 [Neolewinella maritima]|uniref:Plasmid pRiA4b Orf3-like domain-containing protein n=1 Tax=Neolewinella maritima TaxID=1383882 RepID=A0ABM9B5R0_9BACT|nr:plasmid pRiA4b ORF-3 family protein [Neolewinella maritima]CAH1002247.1 hypothetical protein LEM8419_03165 [Neolewinella maritima]
MSTDNLQQALANAAAQAREQHPELTVGDVEAAYAAYHRHFELHQDEPPVSDRPAVDELLLALWDVIVDREEQGMDDPADVLDAYYAAAFSALLSANDNEDSGHPVVAMSPPVEVAPQEPAPPLEEDDEAVADIVAPDDPRGHIYTVRVSLDGSDPEIWRRILIPSTVPQTELHYIIQAAMGWRGTEQYQFLPPQERDLPTSGEPLLKDLLPTIGDDCGYEFDRGATWYHHLLLEDIGEAEGRRHYPVCTAGQRACPPEDVGSLREYEEMIAKMQDPTNDEYREMAGWLTQDFNPAAFNIEQANLRLGRHGQVGFQAVV